MYFYFILIEDYPDDKTVINLELENIAYFFYSIKNEQFSKDGYVFELEDINKEAAKITKICEDNEYNTFSSKKNLIKYMEKYLNKKRHSDSNIIISEKFFNSARKHLFKLTPNIYLDKDTKIFMTKIVKENNTYFESHFFTFQFVYIISYSDYYFLNEEYNLIGVIVESIKSKNKEKNKKSYHFFYMGKIYNKEKSLNPNTLEKLINFNRLGRIQNFEQSYIISKLPDNLCNQIFIFKIYEIKHEKMGIND